MNSYYLRREKGRYWTISTPLLGELICPWENGEVGSMIDIYDSDTLRFIDFEHDPNSEDPFAGLQRRHLTEDEMKQCPIVAEGIIVFWIKCCEAHAFQYDAAQLFDDYYEKCFQDYERWKQRSFDYWKHKESLPLAFAKKHLADEMRRIANSKALSEFLPANDNEQIRQLTENYIEYVKDKVNQLQLNHKRVGRIELNIFTDDHNVKRIVEELKKIDRTGFGPKEFVAVVQEFFISISWLTEMDNVKVVTWMNQKGIVNVKVLDLKHVNRNPENKDKLIEKLKNSFQRKNSAGRWEDIQAFFLPGCEKINKG